MSTDIKEALKRLAGLPIELLDRKAQDSLRKTIAAVSKKIAETAQKLEISQIEANIPFEDRLLFSALLKEQGPGKKNKSQHEKAARLCNELSARLRPLIQKYKKAEEAIALKEISELDAKSRLYCSLLARVTNTSGKLLKLTTSKKNHKQWRDGLFIK